MTSLEKKRAHLNILWFEQACPRPTDTAEYRAKLARRIHTLENEIYAMIQIQRSVGHQPDTATTAQITK